MKIEFEVKSYITFSFDIPSEYEKLVGAKCSEVATMSDEELDKREEYYDKMYQLAHQIIDNDFKGSTIDGVHIVDLVCNRTY